MKKKIPTILGVTVLLIGVVTGVFLVENKQIFKLRASPEIQPKNLRVTNITDTSLTVTYTTDSQVATFLQFGEEVNMVTTPQTPQSLEPGNIHSVTLSGLTESKLYYFTINSDGRNFDNNGIPWEAKTGKKLAAPDTSLIISGKILNQNEAPIENVLVYSSLSGGPALSAITNSDGIWILPLSLTRTVELDDYSPLDETTSEIEITVQGGALGVSSALIYPLSAQPTPNIYLGQTYDFRNVQPSAEGTTPNAEIDLTSNQNDDSGFTIDQTSAPQDEVTLESVDNGEVIYTPQPEFFGDGPAGTDITITVESDPITETVTVEEDGFWRWNVPEDLEDGIHKVTVKWTDANGILQTITKSFVVNAQEGPAFVSTPSATPTPTTFIAPSATPTPTKTPTPTPTSTIKPTGTITPTATKTPTPTKVATVSPTLPNAGTSTPTIFILLGALSLIVFSAFVTLGNRK